MKVSVVHGKGYYGVMEYILCGAANNGGDMMKRIIAFVVLMMLAACGGGGSGSNTPTAPGVSSVTKVIKPIGTFERYSTVFGQYSTPSLKGFGQYSTVYTKQPVMITSTEKVELSLHQVAQNVSVGTPMYLDYLVGATWGYVENADSSIAMLCVLQY